MSQFTSGDAHGICCTMFFRHADIDFPGSRDWKVGRTGTHATKVIAKVMMPCVRYETLSGKSISQATPAPSDCTPLYTAAYITVLRTSLPAAIDISQYAKFWYAASAAPRRMKMTMGNRTPGQLPPMSRSQVLPLSQPWHAVVPNPLKLFQMAKPREIARLAATSAMPLHARFSGGACASRTLPMRYAASICAAQKSAELRPRVRMLNCDALKPLKL
mmetsp:Transcript_5576/g.15848  ORF Transcript_5576/g.15848 Transcript_5576/m.15848 type:complete len:217 (+) Transcript_5576:132-782(+)